MTNVHLKDGETFIQGRSPEKARELLGLAEKHGVSGVRTTTNGYIVPKVILGEAAPVEEEAAPADVEASEDTAALFDPSEHNAEEVLSYLHSAEDEERARVLAAEQEGKQRKSVLSFIDNEEK